MKTIFKLFLIVIVIFVCATLDTYADEIPLGKKEVILSQKSYPISAIDPNATNNVQGSFFPGLRGTNQLIVYTPKFGLRTNTNEFGSEAIVKDCVVDSLSGADSIIPFEGFVISGHGRAKKWINENIIVGAKIQIDYSKKVLIVYTTSESYLYGARQKIKETQEIINYYKRRYNNYNSDLPNMYIRKAEKNLKRAERIFSDVQKYSSLAIENANEALHHSIPYDENELKGVWIRPTEKSSEAIIATLNRMQSAGLNNIFLETYFHGKTIYPSKVMDRYMFTPQNESFVGFDPLKIWITEAHKRGIKVNIWFESFYVGNKNPKLYPQSILAVQPSWANVTKKNFDSRTPVPSVSEHNGYFLDPANPEVQAFLIELIQEIVWTYKPDGINLDYIRYPQSVSPKFSSYDLSNWGYTEYARMDFQALYGVDPLELTYSDSNWKYWDEYRRGKIAEFIQKVSVITKSKKMLLTAVIFPDRQKALETKQQDWKKWSYEGYVDGFTPLLLTSDEQTASLMMRDVNNNKSNNTALYAGLFSTFMSATEDDLLKQIHASRKMRAKGVILFDYAHLQNKYVKALMTTAFNKDSVIDPNEIKCADKKSNSKVQKQTKDKKEVKKSDNKNKVKVKKDKKVKQIKETKKPEKKQKATNTKK